MTDTNPIVLSSDDEDVQVVRERHVGVSAPATWGHDRPTARPRLNASHPEQQHILSINDRDYVPPRNQLPNFQQTNQTRQQIQAPAKLASWQRQVNTLTGQNPVSMAIHPNSHSSNEHLKRVNMSTGEISEHHSRPTYRQPLLQEARYMEGGNTFNVQRFFALPDRSSEPTKANTSSQCTNCYEQGISCDGMRPCAYCEEPGFDCIYPNSKMTSVSDTGLETSTVKLPYPNQSHLPSDQPQRLVREAKLPRPQELSILDNGWLPRSLKELTNLLKTHEKNLNMHQEYMLQARLMQARARAQVSINIPTANRDLPPPQNPFRRLWNGASEQLSAESSLVTTKIQIKAQQSKKKQYVTTILPLKALPVDRTSALMPRYKSIGRMGTSFLAKNVHTLTYMPYFADDEVASDEEAEKERNAELLERYQNKGNHNEMQPQRKCAERVWHWIKTFQNILEELSLDNAAVAAWTKITTRAACRTCHVLPNKVDLDQQVTQLDAGTLQRCNLLAEAFDAMTGIPVWHFLHHENGIPQQNPNHLQPGPLAVAQRCLVCFTHNCLLHGAYKSSDSPDDNRDVFINDPEDDENQRKRVVHSSRPEHVCGLFCSYSTTSDRPISRAQFERAVSINSTGEVKGDRNKHVTPILFLAEFQTNNHCPRNCFLNSSSRQEWFQQPNLDAVSADVRLRRMALAAAKTYKSYVRTPCMLARLAQTTCVAALYALLLAHANPPHLKASVEYDPVTSGVSRVGARTPGWYNTENRAKLDERQVILPCDHDGPCTPATDCACAKDKVFCERFCGCDKSCRRRFKGCNCAMNNPKGVCFMDERCDCHRNNRECDPWVCGHCGVLEVLDPPNKYHAAIRVGRCQNCRLQLDLPAKTIQSRSEIQGWGLYAGEDLAKNDFIGEYKGEIISAGDWSESHRRGVVYHNGGLEYLFTINKEQELDGSAFGNKMRFMNNSQLDEYINVASQKLISNGVQRIMFYAKRAVSAGEELLYNYNYPEEITAAFWEPGDQRMSTSNDATGVSTKPAKPRFSRHVARQAGAVGSQQTGDASSQQHNSSEVNDAGRGKRKRSSASLDDGQGTDASDASHGGEQDLHGDGSDDAESFSKDRRAQLIGDLTRWHQCLGDVTRGDKDNHDEEFNHVDSPTRSEHDLYRVSEENTGRVRLRRKRNLPSNGASQRRTALTRKR